MLVVLLVVAVVVVVGAFSFVAVRRPHRRPLPPPTHPVEQVHEPRGVPAAASVPAPVAVPEPEPVAAPAPEGPPRLRDRLGRARELVAAPLASIRGRQSVDEETYHELETVLLLANVGNSTTKELLDNLRTETRSGAVAANPDALLAALRDSIVASFSEADRSLSFEPDGLTVWLVVGVNGVGKTTTIGKIAAAQTAEHHDVVLAAGDTFRAAAVEQLSTWATRSGASLIAGSDGADPSSVIFNAIQHAEARGADLVIADTAGRFHNRVNLMEELKKIRRVAGRPPGVVTEVLLVIDATTGQNGLVQAQEFAEATGVTGIVLTKLDGTAKGGIALAIERELDLPIKLVGVGESVADLVVFDPEEFATALVGP